MRKIILGLAVVVSFSSFANEEVYSYTQDVYLAAEVGRHTLEVENYSQDIDGGKFSLLFGGRNILKNGLFFGGEFEGSLYNNKGTISGAYLDVQYGYGASASIGKQWSMSDANTFSIYGLIGYSAIHVEENHDADATLDGFKWGGGADFSFSDWMVGARYTYTNLDDYFDEQNISLIVGRKFNF
ncbi:hypothetical protein P7F88_08075 [Vibrio hannami]|uniref:hypothetical protein n=1 Tax=Vibrio hannami TaxID=2717094 RepID=UPI00240EF6F8|nr:hypothetical protein [Vibrio hannami]MDG3086054.1 hypothetical protein [Vibrio hannami]